MELTKKNNVAFIHFSILLDTFFKEENENYFLFDVMKLVHQRLNYDLLILEITWF